MTDFRGNIDNWIRLSEPDYYTLFIRVWIPFNAWYVAEMPQHKKKDRLLIKELQDNPKSKPRLKIESLLRSNDPESINFKHNLAQLHFNLEKRCLTDNKKLLSFTSIDLTENPIKHKSDFDRQGNKYKAESKVGYFDALIVDKNNKTLFNYRTNSYDLNDLIHDIRFIGLKDFKIQNKIKACFEEINPNKPINLISASKNKADYIMLDNTSKVKFINDVETIAKSCIKVIYSLRCMLFHGEVDPTGSNASVYENGYNILKVIVKELR